MNAPHLRFRDRTCPVWTFFVSQAGKRYRTSHGHYPHRVVRAEGHALAWKQTSALEALSCCIA